MDTEVTLIEQFFGERLSPDLIQLVAAADYRRLHAFQQAERQFERSYRLPGRASGQYRPYISGDTLTFEELSHGLTVGETTRFYESHDPTDLFKAADSLQQHLLFCHTVVLNSPLGFICDLFFDKFHDTFEVHRAHLAHYLTFLNYVRPLVEAQILFLLPRRRSHGSMKYFGAYPPHALSDADIGRIVQWADFTSMHRYLPAEFAQSELARKVHTRAAEESILITLMEEVEQGGQLDLYVPHPYFVDVLRELVPVLAKQGIEKGIARDALRVGELAKINLPGLESLQPEDIVSLRRDEESFVAWRSSLSRALDRIIQLPPETFERDTEATAILKGELVESSMSLAKTVQSSSALRKASGPIRSFALGAVGALATAALSAPGPAVAAGAVTTAVDLLLTFLSNGTSEGSRALRRHFAVFQKDLATP